MKALLLLVACALALAGCGKRETTGGAGNSSAKALTIAVIPKGTTHEFWQSIHAGAVKAERELKEKNVPVEIIWQGPLREDDRNAQIQTVEGFTTRRVSGIVLAAA
jgi:ribose transport system substrate-binding protein